MTTTETTPQPTPFEAGEQDRQQQALQIAARLLSAPHDRLDDHLQSLLQLTGDLLGVDRALIFLMQTRHSWSGTHGWCREGVPHLPHDISDRELDAHSRWFINELQTHGLIRIDDSAHMPPEASGPARLLERAGTQSVCAVPLWAADTFIGFMALDAVNTRRHWIDSDVTWLRLMASFVSASLVRQRIEEEREAGLQRFEALFHSIPDAVLVADQAAGTVVSANMQAGELFGMPPSQLVGMKFPQLHPPWILEHEKRHFETQLERDDKALIHESVILHASGREIPVEISNGRRYEINGRTYQVGLFRDISERKAQASLVDQTTQALRASEAKYRQLVENLSSEYFFYTNDANGAISFISSSVTNMLGWTPEEMMGPYQPFVTDHPVNEQIAAFTEAGLRGDKQPPYLLQARHKDGSARWIEMTETPVFDAEGRVTGLEGIGHDVTQRLQNELELEQHRHHLSELVETRTAELKAANQAKSIFLANMSHEIRTPLNAVIGFADILARDPALQARQREQVVTIARSGKHLLGLINDILDLTKIEAGRLHVNAADFPLRGLLDELKTLFAVRAEGKGLLLQWHLARDLPDHVHGDEGKLRQVLINLLGNAVKFTQKGQVSLRAGRQANNTLWFEVEDTGPGMSREELDGLFQPFHQTESGKKSGGGTGLGLSISQKLLRLMGGDIQVHSQPGKGSCFRCWLPMAPASAPVSTPAVMEPVRWRLPEGMRPPRVLVVDDLPDNRQLLTDLLAVAGFEVIEAADGAMALDVFNAQGADVVLMDMRMPVMDGYEATRQTKSISPQTPVIAITASALEDDRQAILDSGVDAFLSKPVDGNRLMQLLWQFLALPAQAPGTASGPTQSGSLSRTHVHHQLPAPLCAALENALLQGDLQAFEGLLKQAAPEASELVGELVRLAHAFQLDALHHLFDASSG